MPPAGPKEEPQIVDQGINVVDSRANRHHGGVGMGCQGRGHQRTRRAPDSVQSGRLACLEAGDNLGEAFLPLPLAD